MRKRNLSQEIYDAAVLEYQESIKELHRAMKNFNNAEAEYFDIANHHLTAAKANYSACYRKIILLQSTKSKEDLKKTEGAVPSSSISV